MQRRLIQCLQQPTRVTKGLRYSHTHQQDKLTHDECTSRVHLMFVCGIFYGALFSSMFFGYDADKKKKLQQTCTKLAGEKAELEQSLVKCKAGV